MIELLSPMVSKKYLVVIHSLTNLIMSSGKPMTLNLLSNYPTFTTSKVELRFRLAIIAKLPSSSALARSDWSKMDVVAVLCFLLKPC